MVKVFGKMARNFKEEKANMIHFFQVVGLHFLTQDKLFKML